MAIRRRNERFVQEFVLVFGFLNGLWIYAGINPETEILRAFTQLVPEVASFLFWIVVIILTIGPLIATYSMGKGIGKCLGIVAVLLAFLGGVFIESWGIWSLLIGVIIGWYAPLAKAK